MVVVLWSFSFHRDLPFLSLQWFCLNIPADLRNKWHLVIDRLTVLFLKFLEYFHKMQVFVWWLLELHIIKIVSSYIIWVTVKEASKFPLSNSYTACQHLPCAYTPKCRERASPCQTSLKLWDPAGFVHLLGNCLDIFHIPSVSRVSAPTFPPGIKILLVQFYGFKRHTPSPAQTVCKHHLRMKGIEGLGR